MSLQVPTGFFIWCTITNTTLFLFSALARRLMPGRVYRLQRRWIPLSREAFSLAFYSFLARTSCSSWYSISCPGSRGCWSPDRPADGRSGTRRRRCPQC